jgi:hypothetical protein
MLEQHGGNMTAKEDTVLIKLTTLAGCAAAQEKED